MENLIELSKSEMSQMNGGDSIGYRVGQAAAIVWDLTFGGLPGIFDTKGGSLALLDWFG